MTWLQVAGATVLTVMAMNRYLDRGSWGWLVPWAILTLMLNGCEDLPRHVLGRWDRVVASGTWVPEGTLDRMTVWYEGDVRRERGGAVQDGTWGEDGDGTVTLWFGGPPETWRGSQPPWCPDGSTPCLRLRRPGDDDWYRGGSGR